MAPLAIGFPRSNHTYRAARRGEDAMTKPFKVRDPHGLRGADGCFSISNGASPGKLPDPKHFVPDDTPGSPPGKVERDDPATEGSTPLPPPPKPEARPDKKPFRFNG